MESVWFFLSQQPHVNETHLSFWHIVSFAPQHGSRGIAIWHFELSREGWCLCGGRGGIHTSTQHTHRARTQMHAQMYTYVTHRYMLTHLCICCGGWEGKEKEGEKDIGQEYYTKGAALSLSLSRCVRLFRTLSRTHTPRQRGQLPSPFRLHSQCHGSWPVCTQNSLPTHLHAWVSP